MGTRRLVGYVINGEVSGPYNHWDSYPAALGVKFLKEVKEQLERLEEFKNELLNLTVVNSSDNPEKKDITNVLRASRKHDVEFYDGKVSTGEDWYSCLRNCCGSLVTFIKSGYIFDDSSFLKDSLFCEWAYIIDFDNKTFDVYKGSNKKVPTDGIFSGCEDKEENGYYAVNRIASYPLDSLPTEEKILELENTEE